MNSGKCQCGAIGFTIDLPERLSNYSPRQCDCDFCTSRHISYVSDPKGKIILKCGHSKLVLKQGDEQADFIGCSNCESIVAVIYQSGQSVKGAINSTMLDRQNELGEPQVVSPKKLTAEQKVSRWKTLWCEVIFE
ncbi:aldehyde-activating protein [Aliikangiella coralliicola]|uniref:Aldehyde-activating protein n=1 Tax=Aliikangiella coralliicola TaxID=2592383 RepID=A0A545UGR5_9GAMM|nr:aldehyde-activating protein [Aliikangiella coralliicola]TQV88635.1 aldehyde-activating protein [Aliikangiella coralliicola]